MCTYISNKHWCIGVVQDIRYYTFIVLQLYRFIDLYIAIVNSVVCHNLIHNDLLFTDDVDWKK